MRSVLNIHWKDWCWSWNSKTLAIWCEELTHLKRPWCWEDWRQEEKGTTEDEMVVWHHRLNGHEFEQARSWGWTGKPGVLQSMGLQRVRDDWATELNWCLPVTWALPSSFYLTYFDIFFAIDTFTLKIFNKWLWLWFEHARTYNIHIDICRYIYTMNEIKLTWLGKLN